MMTSQEAEAIYDSDKETVVRVLPDMDRRMVERPDRIVPHPASRLRAS